MTEMHPTPTAGVDPAPLDHVTYADAAVVTPEPDPEPAEKVTGQEVANSLTGFDEVAISQRFRKSLDQLDALMVTRSLVFTLLRRDGVADKEAYDRAMHMPQSEVETFFAPESRDPMGEDEAGNE